MILRNKLINPLEELQLDGFKKLNDLLKINHHSPTSSSMPLGVYAFRYLFSTQDQRREFDGNANMAAGVAVNDAIQWHLSNKIWSYNPNIKKLAPRENNKLSKDEAIHKALEKFNEYVPVDDKDREKKEHYQETIPQTIRQGYLAFEKIGADKAAEVVAEDSINHVDHRLSLPVVGRADLHFTDFNASERSGAAPSHSISSEAPFLSVCELKTVWQRAGKVKKDGTRSFASAKVPSTPLVNHLQQLAFYCFSLRKLNRIFPYLVYLSADDYMVFTEKNCADLEIQNLNNYYEQLIDNCIRKERLLARYIDLEEPELILAEIAKDVEPGFDHQFYWNIGAKHLARAKKIWSKS
ncbi:putative signal transduction protein with Nacht domain [uncultured Mediterranean phage uvMED]|nr:putative signal transduction protein with Nacht domain [uncultured Mediterranean phage uvMED]